VLQAGSKRRERILVYGESGSGKSSTWVSIAQYIEKTKGKARVFLQDTDRAYEAVEEAVERVVTCYDAELDRFGEWKGQIQKWRRESGQDDWLVVDMIDKAWAGAQTQFWNIQSGGSSLGEIYLKGHDNAGFLSGDYGSNWGVINKLYDDWMQQVVAWPGHVLACTPADQVFTDKQNNPIQKGDMEWVKWRFKPAGQKRLKHAFHTVLLAQEQPTTRGPQWSLTTIKERGPVGGQRRQMLLNETVTEAGGFTMGYLVKVAGWRL
jgi:energy-coupling factor transporter ATP-binding protein EcfA2